MNPTIETILESVPAHLRANIVMDDKLSPLHSLAVTVAHLVSRFSELQRELDCEKHRSTKFARRILAQGQVSGPSIEDEPLPCCAYAGELEAALFEATAIALAGIVTHGQRDDNGLCGRSRERFDRVVELSKVNKRCDEMFAANGEKNAKGSSPQAEPDCTECRYGRAACKCGEGDDGSNTPTTTKG